MKGNIIVFVIVVFFFSILGVICIKSYKRNQEYNRQMKENAIKFHEEASKARYESEEGEREREFNRKNDSIFWNSANK